MPACCSGVNTELKNAEIFWPVEICFKISPIPPECYKNHTELPLLPESQPGSFVLHRAKRRLLSKGLQHWKRGLWYINSPFQVQKIFSSHSASPLSLLVSSACSCSPAGRYKTRYKRVTTMISLQHRRKTAMGHKKAATEGHSSVPAHGGGRAACAGLMGPSLWPPLYPQQSTTLCCSMDMKN